MSETVDTASGNAHSSASAALHADADVVIVGAGPVGLTLALLLAKRERSVAIYERWPGAYPLPRAAAMSHETVRTFQSAGILEPLRPYLQLNLAKVVASFFGPQQEVLASMRFPGRGESGFPPMIGFNQPDVDRFLGEMCEQHPLIRVHRGWNARSLEQTADYALLHLDPADGDTQRPGAPVAARGRFVVGCDGANSVVRGLMKTEVIDTGFSSSWLVVDTLLVPGSPPIDLFGHVLDPARPATIAPAGVGRHRFEFMIMPEDDMAQIAKDEVIWPLLRRWEVTPDRVKIARKAIYTFRGRWADTWRDGRVLLAGDAAHQMPPFMGQGFNSGVRDSLALAWRIDLIMRGLATDQLLDSYTSERQHHVKEIIESSVAIGQMICLADPAAAAERDDALRRMSQDPDAVFPQPEWRLGPGCFMPGDEGAGFLACQARVEKDGRTALLDELTGSGKFLLLGQGVEPLAGVSASARAAWLSLDGSSVKIADDGYRDVDGDYAAWFAKFGAPIVLARPDFQIFGVSQQAAGVDAMIEMLRQQLNA